MFTVQCFILATFVAAPVSLFASDGPRIGILAPQQSITLAQPLIIVVTYRFTSPPRTANEGAIFTTIQHHASVRIFENDTGTGVAELPLFPGFLRLEKAGGSTYTGSFTIMYDFSKRKRIFQSPGVYAVQLCRTKTDCSNTLIVNIDEPSPRETEVLSMLSDPNDYIYLEFGAAQDAVVRRQIVSRLRRVVDRGADTLIARWAAARMGVDRYSEVVHVYVQDTNKKLDSMVASDAFKDVNALLGKGRDLPDYFPISEEALYRLAIVESLKGKDDEAVALVHELAAKWPNGRYSSIAASAIAHLRRRREPQGR